MATTCTFSLSLDVPSRDVDMPLSLFCSGGHSFSFNSGLQLTTLLHDVDPSAGATVDITTNAGYDTIEVQITCDTELITPLSLQVKGATDWVWSGLFNNDCATAPTVENITLSNANPCGKSFELLVLRCITELLIGGLEASTDFRAVFSHAGRNKFIPVSSDAQGEVTIDLVGNDIDDAFCLRGYVGVFSFYKEDDTIATITIGATQYESVSVETYGG